MGEKPEEALAGDAEREVRVSDAENYSENSNGCTVGEVRMRTVTQHNE